MISMSLLYPVLNILRSFSTPGQGDLLLTNVTQFQFLRTFSRRHCLGHHSSWTVSCVLTHPALQTRVFLHFLEDIRSFPISRLVPPDASGFLKFLSDLSVNVTPPGVSPSLLLPHNPDCGFQFDYTRSSPNVSFKKSTVVSVLFQLKHGRRSENMCWRN